MNKLFLLLVFTGLFLIGNFFGEEITAKSEISIDAQTDKNSYTKGETVIVTGIIRGFDPKVHSDVPISAMLRDANESVLVIAQAVPNSNGSFIFKFKSSHGLTDDYSIILLFISEESVTILEYSVGQKESSTSETQTSEETESELLVGTSSPRISVKESGIPNWIKTNSGWWAEGQIDDDTFVSAIKFLITEDVLKIPSTAPRDNSPKEIPGWIKTTVGWWAEQKISDSEFVSAIQYLISNGILGITDDKIECSGSALCLTENVRRIVDGDTIYTGNYIVRLSLTNTPEANEPGGAAATSFTADLCPLGSEITIDQDDLQPYVMSDRLVGKVYCGGRILNSELLYNEHAEILTQHCSTSEFSDEIWAKKYGC